PGERVARAAYRRCGGAETQHAMREGIERRFELEHRHRAWPIGEPHAPPRYRPAAPLQALDAGAGLEPERVERALQADEHARSAPTGGSAPSATTLPSTLNVSSEAGPRSSQRARSRSRACSVKSRAPVRAPFPPSNNTPSACTAPPAEWRSAWVSSAASGPLSCTLPATAPRSGRAEKLPLRPSNDSESAVRSAYTPSVSLRPSSRTVPVSLVGGRAPSRCSSVPVNCTSRNGPLRVPSAYSRPCRAAAGTSRSTVPRSTTALTVNGWKRRSPPAPPPNATSPRPRIRVSGRPGTSESRKVQSTSSVRPDTGPVAVVWPFSHPANGSVS